jgi:hypothetical protein
MAKTKWYTVSKNPSGFLGQEASFHVEPGRVRGHHHVKASSPRDAIKKATGRISGKRIARGYF